MFSLLNKNKEQLVLFKYSEKKLRGNIVFQLSLLERLLKDIVYQRKKNLINGEFLFLVSFYHYLNFLIISFSEYVYITIVNSLLQLNIRIENSTVRNLIYWDRGKQLSKDKSFRKDPILTCFVFQETCPYSSLSINLDIFYALFSVNKKWLAGWCPCSGASVQRNRKVDN